MRWRVTTPPAAEPVTLADAKAHLKVDHTAEDAQITQWVIEARQWCENFTRRALISQGITMILEAFPESTDANPYARLVLPRGRTVSVGLITYIDSDGISQQLTGPTSSPLGTDWQEDLFGDGGGILQPPVDGEWPDVQTGALAPIVIDYTAGYGSAGSNVPGDLLSAIKFRLADLYQVRGQADLGTRALAGEWTRVAEAYAFKHRIDTFARW